MALRPLALHDLATQVLACVCVALNDVAAEVDGHPACPCRSCVVPGTPAWDSCTDPCGVQDGAGGQLTVSYSRWWPSTEFPARDQSVRGLGGCQPPSTTAAELVVTLLRCAPVVDERGCPPACVELEAAAQVAHVDAAAVYSALQCCLPTTAGARGRRFVMGEGRILGPQGGCVGVEQRVIVALPGCAPCPGESL